MEDIDEIENSDDIEDIDDVIHVNNDENHKQSSSDRKGTKYSSSSI